MEIWQFTREQYFNNVDLVRAQATKAGVKGEKYQVFRGKGKTLRVVDKYRELDNLQLFEFGKKAHRDAVIYAISKGYIVSLEVLEDYPDLIEKDKNYA